MVPARRRKVSGRGTADRRGRTYNALSSFRAVQNGISSSISAKFAAGDAWGAAGRGWAGRW
ncbi:MAG: hypothetical protein WBF88_10100, partial [Pusillimonas sp.]